MLIWPLKEPKLNYPIPIGNEPGAFGVQRHGYIHSGIDIYCEPKTKVVAIEKGVVVSVEDFTGPKVNTPWWNDTRAILVEGESGVICYGEVLPLPFIEVGDIVEQGQIIAETVTVLKKYKGNPMTMLHFELYNHGTKETVNWVTKDNKPENLLNPTEILLKMSR